jgi:hypothetical protein
MLDRLTSDSCPPALKEQFRREFERLVVLDYITRNTGAAHGNPCIGPCWPLDALSLSSRTIFIGVSLATNVK